MTEGIPSLTASLRQKAERQLVYPLNRDECLALVDVAEAADAHLNALGAAAKARLGGYETDLHQVSVNASDNVLALKLHALSEVFGG